MVREFVERRLAFQFIYYYYYDCIEKLHQYKSITLV